MTKTEELKNLIKSKGLNYVGTRGNANAPVWFVGEAPGANEDACGLPFMGASGQLQDNIIAEARLSQNDICFTNPYKTRPPDNDLDRFGELGIPRELCIDQFIEELNETRPTFIVSAGATSLGILCPFSVDKKTGEAKVGPWRGSLLRSPRLAWPHYVVPYYHPAFILRDYSEKQISVFILQRLAEEFEYWRTNGSLQPLPQRELLAQPSYDEAFGFLTECLDAERVSVDIEMFKRRFPYLLGFAPSAKRAISICLNDFPAERAVTLWRIIDKILRIKQLVGQNFTNFDAHWLEYLGFGVADNIARLPVDDTRIRHTVLWPALSHKLEFMTMQYTREPYYKEEGKAWFGKAKDALEYRRYNCKDACVTYEIFERQEEELVEDPTKRSFYDKFGRQLARRFFFISRRGLRVNRQRLTELDSYIKDELSKHCKTYEKYAPGKTVVYDASQQKLCEKAGVASLNVGSGPQLKELFKNLGLKVYRKRGTRDAPGGETLDEEHLQLMFAETGHEAVEATLAIRELNKIRTATVNAKYPDNIMYSDYIVGGTIFGRRSSRQVILGFGVNGQNVPKHSKLAKKFRECVEAHPGKILVGCDQILAEDWIIQGIIADQLGDVHVLDELYQGIDRHQKLAMYLFNASPEDCHKDNKNSILRHVAKRTRYGMSFDMQGEKLSLIMAKEGIHIPSKETTFLLARAHQAEPAIKQVYHEYVKRELVEKKKLINLFGRETVFFGLHPYRDNSAIFREGYACIPQGTVGDNTGNAILFLEDHNGNVVADTHDAVLMEVDDNFETFYKAIRLLRSAFDTTLRFPNGLELKIPVEFEFGYSLEGTKTCVNLEETSLRNTYDSLPRPQRVHRRIITGAVQV